MKKLLALLLAAMMLLGTGVTALADYDTHLTFKVASYNVNESVDYNGDVLSKHFEDKFNFDWDMISLSNENGVENIRIWINAMNMPDVVIANQYNNGEMMNYFEQGLIYRFPDDWKERWPNAAKAFEMTAIGDAVTEKAGGTYMFPRAIFANNYPAEKIVTHMSVYLRKDWAQAVGFELKDAYKTSELLEFARLLKEKDPGNVGERLIPIAVQPLWANYLFTLPNNAYSGGQDTPNEFYIGEDGKYHWGPASEDTLTGLKLYRQAIDEGLLAPEFYSYTGTEANEDFYIAGIAGMTIMQGMASFMDLTANYVKTNLNAEFDDVVHVAAVIGEDGKYHGTELINYSGYVMFKPDISTEEFERYMDLMDYAATDDAQMLIRMGFKGEDWDYDENGEIVSHYPEGQSARSKYPSIYPVYHRLVIMSDDFTLINPAYKKEYRDRVAQLYIIKNELADEKSIAPVDWTVLMHSSDAMSRIGFTYPDEYAAIVLQDGDVEQNWKDWVSTNSYLIDPVLDELNELIGK
ncbi:MAG: ABC transporter substrate-binding protein [Clostridia bacterium]|nr:ABC transporter substrate-binding protein [Clostridia bacterium]